MKICRPRPQLVFTFDNRFSSTGYAAQQSVRYIIFRLQASYLSATSHTGRKSCRVKSLFKKRFWPGQGPHYLGLNVHVSTKNVDQKHTCNENEKYIWYSRQIDEWWRGSGNSSFILPWRSVILVSFYPAWRLLLFHSTPDLTWTRSKELEKKNT